MSDSDFRLSAALPLRSLNSLLEQGNPRASQRVTGAAQTVPLKPLTTGQHLLAQMPIQEVPKGSDWRAMSYRSITPRVVELRDALVHGGAGIVRAGLEIVTETIYYTNTLRDSYEIDDHGVRLRRSGPVVRIAGTAISLLAGNHDDYGRWTLECLSRLAVLDRQALAQATQVLVPKLAHGFQRESLALTGIGESHTIREVDADESLDVRRLLLPESVLGDVLPHPCLRAFFSKIAESVGPSSGDFALERLYIDRRGEPDWVMDNEDEVITALEPLGFIPVRTHTLDLPSRIRLIRGAKIVVAAYGSGLTDLVYARPGCQVVELLMNGFVNWRHRRLSAIFDLPYDCVIGRIVPGDATRAIEEEHWTVSPMHVVAAVRAALDTGSQAPYSGPLLQDTRPSPALPS